MNFEIVIPANLLTSWVKTTKQVPPFGDWAGFPALLAFCIGPARAPIVLPSHSEAVLPTLGITFRPARQKNPAAGKNSASC
jgi:hypothetical protein